MRFKKVHKLEAMTQRELLENTESWSALLNGPPFSGHLSSSGHLLTSQKSIVIYYKRNLGQSRGRAVTFYL